MKTPILMAAILAGFGLISTGAQAQGRPDFATLDVDGNGLVTMTELATQGKQRFVSSDTNNDGSLSEAELLASVPERAEDRATEIVARMLDRLDENGDGAVQQAELPEHNSERVERRFDRADANGDGALTQAEFEEVAKRGGEGRHGDKRNGDRG